MYKFFSSIFILVALSGCKTTEGIDKLLAKVDSKGNIVRDIGSGNTISIPQTWDFKSYFMPKISGIQPVNYRIETKDMTIAITGFPAKEAKKDAESIKTSLELARTPYKMLANEDVANVTLIDNPNAKGGFASYSCKGDSACFSVLIGVKTQYVTTSIIHGQGDLMYNISIATNSKEMQAEAISSIKTIGE